LEEKLASSRVLGEELEEMSREKRSIEEENTR